MMETVRDKTALIVYRGMAGSVRLFPAVREEACPVCTTFCRAIHITVFCLDVVQRISKVCSVSEIGCISRLQVKRKRTS
jgi:predicted dithiol-disulfide oxidoreductase (DUF899 family)